jgi:hypothetical protein
MSKADIKKQMEYYLGDANLSKDDFFREKIQSGKDGYVELEVFQKCNNIKKLNLKIEDIVAACADSKLLEVSKDKKMIRRVGNKELPEKTGSLKKRDTKANAKKEESKVEEVVDEPILRDEQGRIIF